MDFEKSSQILKALGHPVRLQIVVSLMENECCVNKIAELFSLPQSTVSQHLGVLRNSGVVTPHKSGVMTCYKVKEDYIEEIIKLLKKC